MRKRKVKFPKKKMYSWWVCCYWVWGKTSQNIYFLIMESHDMPCLESKVQSGSKKNRQSSINHDHHLTTALLCSRDATLHSAVLRFSINQPKQARDDKPHLHTGAVRFCIPNSAFSGTIDGLFHMFRHLQDFGANCQYMFFYMSISIEAILP